MKRILILLLFSGTAAFAQNSETLDRLNSAFDESRPQAALDKMFNGGSAGSQEISVYPSSPYQETAKRSAILSPVGASVNNAPIPPVPAPSFAENMTLEKDFDEVAFGERLTSGELKKIQGGLELLKGTQFGDAQYWLYYKEGVELRWSKTGGIAGSNPPTDTANGRKILWLDTELKQVLKTEGDGPRVKAGLAVVMAHEMTHFMDYAKIGSCSTQYCRFMLENNGYLAGTMAYHELRAKGLIPAPNSEFDSEFLQENRFYLDIWNYKHGGPKPDIRSYPLILKLNVDDKKIRKAYDQAVQIISKLSREKNKFSLSEVVNVRCGYKETPGILGPLFHPADADRYNTLFWSIYAAEQKYFVWRKAIGDPVLQPLPVYPQPQQPQQPQPPHHESGNIEDGHSGVDNGNNEHQPAIPNPHFNPDGSADY